MSGYIGTQPVPQSTQTRDSFTATSGQTSFATGGYQSGYIDLYLNGIKLAAADYTATNNSDVVLAVGATTGDILEVVAYTAFNTANVTGAVDFTVTGLFTSRGIDDNADATAITIDSSENVSLTGALDVTGTVTADGLTVDGGGLISNSATGNTLVISGSTAVNTGGNITLEGNTASDVSQIKFKNGSTEVMRVAGGRVLIGTTTEGQGQADNFTVSDSGNMGMTLRSTDSSECSIFFSDATSGAGEYAGSLQYIHSNDSMRFATAGVARMTLDASGNLMTVKTAVDTDAVGSELRSNGLVSSTRTGAEALFLNRKSSNGSIAVFAKDGSTVGSIGTSSGGRLTVGSGSSAAGIRFDGAQWIPTISDAASDNGVDIGWSDSRIRNVYLSGGVYLGGTGSANKLEDYEIGDYTPAKNNGGSVSYSAQNGHYTKVGELVTVYMDMVISSVSGESGNASVTLPFTSKSGDNYMTFNPWIVDSGYTGSSTRASGFVNGGDGVMQMYSINPDNSAGNGYINNNATGRWSGVFTYFTA